LIAAQFCRLTSAAIGLFIVCAGALHAAPGAHGPDGEHLDGPTTIAAGAQPRFEAKSETFELVAELRANELSIYVDRFATNEPVLDAKLDVESGTQRASATFRGTQGDYVVVDDALLKALRAPGQHPVVFTLMAGSDTDLLDGTLRSPGDHGHGHHHGVRRVALAVAGLAVLVAATAGVVFYRNRRRKRAMAGSE
jgi:hypothetical protein